MLQQMAGSPSEAMMWAEALGAQGQGCLATLGVRGDPALVLTTAALDAGLVRPDGTGNRVRDVELVILLDVLDAAPRPLLTPTPDRELVFTVPRSV